ncbi:uncharacterized protein LOC143722631 [Siphateles boraxobius]|uniref:uncharacterized protein LOC143722631 n=1 Tax=Siphateles boraxobius TaxID=180520 RepID=UPI004063CF8F
MIKKQTKNEKGNMEVNDDRGGTQNQTRLMSSHYYCSVCSLLEGAKMIVNLLAGIWILTSLILSGVLAVNWIVRVPIDPVYAPLGSSVVLQCTYDFPEESDQGIRHKVLSEMWCLNQSHCITPRYVYHSAGIFPEPSYQGRVRYFGQTGSKNCSLMISDLRSADSGVYMFRFITDHLKAKLPGQRGVNLQVTHQIQTRCASSSTVGIVFGVIVIIIAIAGIMIFIRHKSRRERSTSL